MHNRAIHTWCISNWRKPVVAAPRQWLHSITRLASNVFNDSLVGNSRHNDDWLGVELFYPIVSNNYYVYFLGFPGALDINIF